jgi:hypothetical protein
MAAVEFPDNQESPIPPDVWQALDVADPSDADVQSQQVRVGRHVAAEDSPVTRISEPQGTIRGRIAMRTNAGTTTRTCPEDEDSVVADPSKTASTTREGPGGSRAVQVPVAVVVTVAASANALLPLLGAVRT